MRISDWSSDVCSSDLSFPSSFLLNWSLGIDAAIIACIEAEIARSPEEFRYFGIGAHQHRTGRGNHRVRGRTPGHAFRQTLGHAGSRADDGVGRNAALTPGDNLLKRAVGNVLRSCASYAMICSRCQEQPRELAADGDGLLKVLVVGDAIADRNSGIRDAVPINVLAPLCLEST